MADDKRMSDEQYIKHLENRLYNAESDRDKWKIYFGCVVVVAIVAFCVMVSGMSH